MIKNLPLVNLGTFGLNTDIAPSSLAPEWFSNAINFKLRDGKVIAYSGSTLLIATPSGFDGAIIARCDTPIGIMYIVCGSTKIYLFTGSAWQDITPTTLGGPAVPELWTISLLGNIVVLNNPVTGPFYFSINLTPEKCLPLPFDATYTWQTKGYTCAVMRSHQNFLFALGMTQGGVALLNSYRWSNPADNNGIPSTWDETDLSAIAGKAEILGGGGVIVDGEPLRDAFVIYSKSNINILEYVGGTYIWQLRELSSTIGVPTCNCIANLFTSHVVLTGDDIITTDGNSVSSLLDQKMKNLILGVIDPQVYYKSFAVTNTQTQEVWVCIPQVGATVPNVVFIYNWLHNQMSYRTLPNGVTSIAIGPVSTVTTTWDGEGTTTWDFDDADWDYDVSSQFTNVIVGVASGNLYDLNTSDGSVDIGTVLERDSCQLDAPGLMNTVIAVYPILACTGPVNIQVGAQEYQGAITNWEPVTPFNPNTDYKVDVMSTGKFHSWRISSIGTYPFTLTSLEFEYTTNGVR